MNLCSGTASAGGLISTIIIVLRQILISNRADAVACAGRYCVPLTVIAFICAMNGRIPHNTGKYIVTSDERRFSIARSVGRAHLS